jgi:N-acetylglucosaminyl-diphospho-decaprenol L-rhamnosyltransferase
VPVDIAFITVNYNTLDCVQHLAAFFGTLNPPFTFSFTVVDNNSDDGSKRFLQSQSNIQYVQTGANFGYGRGINRGVAETESRYVCVMNTDVILNRDALVTLCRFMGEHPDVGLCAPRITYEDGAPQGVAFHRSLFAHYSGWFAKILARYLKLKIEKATTPLKVHGVMGAFFLIRRSAIPATGLFDEDFFFFHEDTALAHTLKNRGVACFIVPAATIIHMGGKSRSESSISSFYKSKYLYVQKFYGPFHARAIYLMDRARIFRKWYCYSLFSLVSGSDRIRSKQRYYKTAWNTARLK